MELQRADYQHSRLQGKKAKRLKEKN